MIEDNEPQWFDYPPRRARQIIVDANPGLCFVTCLDEDIVRLARLDCPSVNPIVKSIIKDLISAGA